MYISRKSLDRSETRIDTVAVALTLGFVLFLVFWGWKYHPIETFGPEIDGYVGMAESIRHGVIPKDHPHIALHPLFYPILATGFSFFVGDTFTGAKFVSSLMAGVFAFVSYLLAVKVFNRKVAILTLLGIVTNFHVIANGVLATTDMTSAAFGILAIFFTVRAYLHPPSLLNILPVSLSFALAYFTRYPMILFLPGIILGIFFSSHYSLKAVFKSFMIFAFSTCIFLCPYFLISTHIFGNPIYNENWKNVAFKVYGRMDWSYFGRIPFDGLSSVILHSPMTFLKAGIHELLEFAQSGVSGLIGLPPILVGLFFIGSYTTLFSLRKAKLIIFSFFVGYTLGISFTFFTGARIMLPILPLCYLVIAEFLITFDSNVRIKKMSIPILFSFALVLCLLKVLVMIPDLKTFIVRHPIKEVEAAVRLEKDYGTDIVVMGTCLQYIVERHVNYEYQELHHRLLSLPREKRKNLNRYYHDLLRILQQTQSDYLLLGRLSMDRTIPSEQHVPQELLQYINPPTYLKLIHMDDDVTIYAVEIEE